MEKIFRFGYQKLQFADVFRSGILGSKGCTFGFGKKADLHKITVQAGLINDHGQPQRVIAESLFI